MLNERGYISKNFSSYYHLYCLKVAKIPLTASREHIWRLLLFLPSDCDDSQTLPRLALRPHRILGLLRAFWLRPRWIGGRPPPPSRRPSYACQNQGGAGRRRSQEEGEESWVVLTLHHDGVSLIPVPGKEGFFTLLSKETLSIRGAFCSFPQDNKDSVCIQTKKTKQTANILSTQPGNSTICFSLVGVCVQHCATTQ